MAGRLQTETDEAGLITTYNYTNGGRTLTVTLPGGATRITDRYLDGRPKSETGTAVVARYFDYGVDPGGLQYSTEYAGGTGPTSPRWTKTTTDWLGRSIRVEQPAFTAANLVRTSAYNSKGQLERESVLAGLAPILADMRHEYDDLGNQVRVGLDLNGDGALTPGSTDRYTETATVFQQTGSDWFHVTTDTTYLTDNSSTPTTLRRSQERLTGFPLNGSWQTVSETIQTDVGGNDTDVKVEADRAGKLARNTVHAPDSTTDAVTITRNGLLQSSLPKTPESATTYTYDALGRPIGTVSPRTGTSTQAYDPMTGRLTSTTNPAQAITYDYYPSTHPSAGRLKSQTNAAGKKAYFDYTSRGELLRSWGDTPYPVEYVYDTFGQRTELHTYRGGTGWQADTWPSTTTGTADPTRWTYHDPSGVLTSKQDAAGRQVAYTYDTIGRVQTRAWARGAPVTTTYTYDLGTGELTLIAYSDGTRSVTMAYDRGGRSSNISDASGTHLRTYNPAGDLQNDQTVGGILNGLQVSVGYDTFLRRSSLQASRGAVTLMSQGYGYDNSSRLQTVTSSPQTVTYTYHPTRGLLTNTGFTGGTAIARTWDPAGRADSITNTPAVGGPASYAYLYDNINRRTRATREDGTYWAYGYNDRNEVTSGKRYWPDSTPIAGQQFEYDFDNIGNRNTAKAGGDAAGANLRLATYSANSLNQYAQRTVPGAADIIGTADPAATVTVNGQSPYRRNDYFRQELTLDNSAGSAHAVVNVVGTRGATVTQQSGYLDLPQAPEAFTYDLDGNLTSDGRWTYTWDAENRLTRMETLSTLAPEARQKLEFAYDFQGRRIEKKVWVWRPALSTYQLQSTTRFVYDGWNLMAELDGANQSIRSHVWGQDVSGTLQGAGGIGGLLLIRDGTNSYQVGYDGNGNVVVLVNAAGGTVSATYDYDPFGVTIKATGEAASHNAFAFSTKYADQESALLYYGQRYYRSSTGRWLSPDPIETVGGTNLYSFAGNSGTDHADPVGLRRVRVTGTAFIPWSWVKIPKPLILTLPFAPLGPVDFYIRGDGRGPGAQPGGSFRLNAAIEVELLESISPEPVVGRPSADNQPSASEFRVGNAVLLRLGGRGNFTPASRAATAVRTGSCSVEVHIKMSGNAPTGVTGPQPNIDYEYFVRLEEQTNQVSADISAEHDGFPGHEMFLESGGAVGFKRHYLPNWFAPQAPGDTATPSLIQAILGNRALAGEFMLQRWTAKAQF